ncbi:MAG: OsmC family protein [Acidobacteriota bacterium]|nr:OsmC family protein [Acidobacteriota bacterium]MDW3229725.1 OsmC family protein [Acidobacteriota bacterium]MDY0231588.1 OsmC family protein [Candidatus Saccharicenans sp.]
MAEKDVIQADWLNGMAFEVELEGHRLVLDVQDEKGESRGPRPKPLLLAALAGCTGMDVIYMLKKMRVPVEKFRLIVEGSLTTEHPKQYSKTHVIYEFTGHNLPAEKLKQAIELSQEKYCGVSATIKKAMPLTWEMKIMES